MKILVGAIVALAVIAAGGYWYLFSGEGEEEATIEAAAQAAAEAQADTDQTATEDSASDESASDEPAEPASVEGVWTAQANDDATFVGYRINEVLTTIGDFEVVGRTREVTGTLTITGTTVESVELTAQMDSLTTDNGARDSAMRSQALETNEFPTATFVLTSPIELGAIPAEGETIAITASGDLTIHGVTQRVDFPLQAQLVGQSIVVVGQLQVELADYDIAAPQARVVASVEDVALLELSVLFDR